MESLIYFLQIAALFVIMMKFGCSAGSKISSPRGNADLPKSEPFRPVSRSFLWKHATSCGDSSNRDFLVRSKLSKGER